MPIHRPNHALETLASTVAMSSKPQPTTTISAAPSTAMDTITDEDYSSPRPPTLFSTIYPHCEPGLKLAFAAAAFAWAVRDYLAGEEANRLAAIANQLALVSVCLSDTGSTLPPNTCTAYLTAFNTRFSNIAEAVAAQEGPALTFTLAGERAPKAALGIFAEMAIVLVAVLLVYVLFKVGLERWDQRRVARKGLRGRRI